MLGKPLTAKRKGTLTCLGKKVRIKQDQTGNYMQLQGWYVRNNKDGVSEMVCLK